MGFNSGLKGLRFILIFSSYLLGGIIPSGYPLKLCKHLYMPRPSPSSWFDHPNNIWWAVQGYSKWLSGF